jgi:hypothetical protein
MPVPANEVCKRIAARARKLGGDPEDIALHWSPYGAPAHWHASVALLPKRQRGRHVTVRARTPLGALDALDRVTADIERQRDEAAEQLASITEEVPS